MNQHTLCYILPSYILLLTIIKFSVAWHTEKCPVRKNEIVTAEFMWRGLLTNESTDVGRSTQAVSALTSSTEFFQQNGNIKNASEFCQP